MNAEAVVTLLEQNWDTLRNELGAQWMDFTSSYREIVRKLSAHPTRESLERTVDEVCDLLSRNEYGRGLLRGYLVRSSDQERLLRPASESLDDQERLQQVCNRLIELITQEDQENREQDNGDKGSTKDSSRG